MSRPAGWTGQIRRSRWSEWTTRVLWRVRACGNRQLDENFTDDHHDPRAMYEKAERQLSDDEFKQSYIIGSDPAHHVERIREIDKLGATVVCLQNGSGADPLGALRTYGKHVLGA